MARASLRRGDWVEVLGEAEIVPTLDSHGAVAGLPFMPEMQPFSGRRFRVSGRAERVCTETAWLSRLEGAVFLDDLRCNGSAHDGCQRGCRFIWSEAWLRKVAGPMSAPVETLAAEGPAWKGLGPTRDPSGRYVCQSTALPRAARPYSEWDPRQYLTDVWSGTLTPSEFLRKGLDACLRRGRRWLGRGVTPPAGTTGRTPSASLGLQPGDEVRVRRRDEITATLDAEGRNRGLWLEPNMLEHCGERHRVVNRVDRIILEGTGEMRTLRDTVVLETLHCRGCARGNQFYWREIWLEKL